MRRLLLILLVLAPVILFAQTSDFGTEYGLSYAFKPWRGSELSLSQELRFKDNSRRFAKSETGIDLQQALFRKPLKSLDMRFRLGAGYHFICRQNASYNIYNQHRFLLQSNLTKDLGQWRLGLRARMQTTLRNPQLGSYKDNPQHCLRLRLSVRYELPDSPWQLSLSHEGFVSLFSTYSPLYDESRTQLSATRAFGKHQSLSMFAKCSQEVQVANPDTYYSLGLSWDFD